MFERRIDMDYLIFAWQDESPGNAYYLDKQTGDVELVQQGLIDLDELTDEIEMNRERYLYIPKPQPTELREDINLFAETVTDPELCRLLPVALEAANLLPALKKVLSRVPQELKRWEEFRARQVRVRIERWLAANCVLGRSAQSDFSPPQD